MMRQTIQQSCCHSFALEYLDPFTKGKVTGDKQTISLIAIGKYLEQYFRSHPAECQIAQFITNQQIGLVQMPSRSYLFFI